MKKTSLLALLFALFGFTTAWAEFSPTPETRYALQEKASGLYLDIQTMDINEPNDNATTNNISLNAKPYTIYFEAGSDGKWKMRNIARLCLKSLMSSLCIFLPLHSSSSS